MAFQVRRETGRDSSSGRSKLDRIEMVGRVDSCCITLRIIGDDVDPRDISRLLGHDPTEGHRKGEQLYGSDGTFRRIAKKGAWHFEVSSNDYPDASVEDVIRLLLDQLTDDVAVWQSITHRYEVDLFCGIFMRDSNRGFSVSADLCQMLGDCGIELGFDVYANLEQTI